MIYSTMSEKTRGKKKVEEKVELIATRRPEDRRLTLFGLLSLNRTLARRTTNRFFFHQCSLQRPLTPAQLVKLQRFKRDQKLQFETY